MKIGVLSSLLASTVYLTLWSQCVHAQVLSNNNILSGNTFEFNPAFDLTANLTAYVGIDADIGKIADEINFDSLVKFGDISPSGFVSLSFGALSFASGVLSSIQQNKKLKDISKQLALINYKLDIVINKLEIFESKFNILDYKLDRLTEQVETLGVSVAEVPFRDRLISLKGNLKTFEQDYIYLIENKNLPDIQRRIHNLRDSIRTIHNEFFANISTSVGIHVLTLSVPTYLVLLEMSGDISNEEKKRRKSIALYDLQDYFSRQVSIPNEVTGHELTGHETLGLRFSILRDRINANYGITQRVPIHEKYIGGSIIEWDVVLKQNEFVIRLNKKSYAYPTFIFNDGPYKLGITKSRIFVWRYCGYHQFRGKNYRLDGPFIVYGAYEFDRQNVNIFKKGEFYYPLNIKNSTMSLPEHYNFADNRQGIYTRDLPDPISTGPMSLNYWLNNFDFARNWKLGGPLIVSAGNPSSCILNNSYNVVTHLQPIALKYFDDTPAKLKLLAIDLKNYEDTFFSLRIAERYLEHLTMTMAKMGLVDRHSVGR